MLIIGLVLLSLVAIFAFFGHGERLFRRIGIPDWLAFLVVLAFVFGAVVPEIRTRGGAASFNVGGFLMPIAFIIILMIVSPAKKGVLRAMVAVVAVAAVTVAARMLIRPETNGLLLLTAAITGILGGITAFLAGRGRVPVLIGAMGGIVLGDTVNNLIFGFVYGQSMRFGASGIFDAVILAAVTGIILFEIVEAMRGAISRRKVSNTALNTEAASENMIVQTKSLKQKERDEQMLARFDGKTDKNAAPKDAPKDT